MKKFSKNKVKKGAASFYIVAFSTLILVIIVASFTAVIISEITRTSNDDLAQSAYDSALAGVEDAKLAVYNYQSCLEDNSKANCTNIMAIMDDENKNCTMVADILSRRPADGGTEVMISETKKGDNNMQQAYTCVMIDNKVENYNGILSNEEQMRVIKTKFNNETDAEADKVHASDIKKVKISWHGNKDTNKSHYNVFASGEVSFPSLEVTENIDNAFLPTPPVISLGMIQTAKAFTLSDFDKTIGDQTDRGMLYLVPATKAELSGVSDSGKNFHNAYNNGSNYISAEGFRKSNDKVTKNLPYVVGCEEDSCTTTIELPEPVNGNRSDDTFVFVVALPYGGPSTEFTLEFYCDTNKPCSIVKGTNGEETGSEVAKLYDVQIKVDSTGRANSLYKRVEARLEPANEFSLSTLGPLEILGSGDNDAGLNKSFYTVCEWNFDHTCNN